MSNFKNMKHTIVGKAILAESVTTGKPLIIDHFIVGDGYLPPGVGNEIVDEVVSPVILVPITDRQFDGNGTVTLSGCLTSAQITTGFFDRELAVIAHLENEAPVVYQYDNAESEASYIPAGGGSVFVEQLFRVVTVLANASSVVIVIDH